MQNMQYVMEYGSLASRHTYTLYRHLTSVQYPKLEKCHEGAIIFYTCIVS